MLQNTPIVVPVTSRIETAAPQRSGPWYALYVRPNAEQAVAKMLREKGYDAFTPTYRLRSRWSDRVVESERPCFPSYVFGRFDAEIKAPIVSTPGVIRIVGFAGRAAVLPDAEMDAVLRLSESMLARPHPFLRVGQRVSVRSGPLAGAEGFLVKFKRECRLVVSISILERSVSAEIDAADVRPM